MKKHYYLAGQVWDGNGDQLKFESLTEQEAEGRDDLVPHPFYLLPEGHPKKLGKVVKQVDKPAKKRPRRKAPVKSVEE